MGQGWTSTDKAAEGKALMTERLFVYGTLAPGRPNEHVLASVPGEWETAFVRGELVMQGWGAAAGFPGINLDGDGPMVHGLLFSSAQLDEHWERLDDFEGDGYLRVRVQVTLTAGGTRTAHIYVLSGL